MRAVRLLPVGLALLAGVLGCSRTINYTAGVCDCNPPNVESVLVPPATARSGSPFASSQMPPAQVQVSEAPVVSVAPKVEQLPQGNPTVAGNHFPDKVPALEPVVVPPQAPLSPPQLPNSPLPR